MDILSEGFYCAGCRQPIDDLEDSTVFTPQERPSRRVCILHTNDACARKYRINHPRWLPPEEYSLPIKVARRVGLEVLGLGDDRRFATIRYTDIAYNDEGGVA